jgi:hypothetical protein
MTPISTDTASYRIMSDAGTFNLFLVRPDQSLIQLLGYEPTHGAVVTQLEQILSNAPHPG